MPVFRCLAFAAALLGIVSTAARAEEPVDLELIIAVDVSTSVDRYEAQLQRQGYVSAFSDERVIEAIQSGFLGKVAVLYFEWAGFGMNKTLMDWTVLSDAESVQAYAARLSRQPYTSGRRTSISGAIDFAVPQFATNGFEGKRRVIDISGDGTNNYGRQVTYARDAAVAEGITINGLPIVEGESGDRTWIPNLDLYYEACVIGGRGAFMVVARGFDDFADAVRQKLVLEISGREPEPSPVREASRSKAPRGPLILAQSRQWERRVPSCANDDRPFLFDNF